MGSAWFLLHIIGHSGSGPSIPGHNFDRSPPRLKRYVALSVMMPNVPRLRGNAYRRYSTCWVLVKQVHAGTQQGRACLCLCRRSKLCAVQQDDASYCMQRIFHRGAHVARRRAVLGRRHARLSHEFGRRISACFFFPSPTVNNSFNIVLRRACQPLFKNKDFFASEQVIQPATCMFAPNCEVVIHL